MEYIDRQQDIELTDKDFDAIMFLEDFIYINTSYSYINNTNVYKLYYNGLTIEKLKTEYKDLPIEWVIQLYM